MAIDRTLQALLNPGEAEDFFSLAAGVTFESSVCDRFLPANALWLAEFCRLIYRQELDEVASRPAGHRTRRQWLTSHGWTEATGHHFQAGTTRASLFTRPAGDVAVLVFRGTLGPGDFLIDLQVPLRPWTG
ncbi:MAG TPA: hypothetical protein DCY13_04095, partial [Verrucomicrobiales bacterium]|nr:hypothetical protein [Verrucomicrobiales bacterium]